MTCISHLITASWTYQTLLDREHGNTSTVSPRKTSSKHLRHLLHPKLKVIPFHPANVNQSSLLVYSHLGHGIDPTWNIVPYHIHLFSVNSQPPYIPRCMSTIPLLLSLLLLGMFRSAVADNWNEHKHQKCSFSQSHSRFSLTKTKNESNVIITNHIKMKQSNK